MFYDLRAQPPEAATSSAGPGGCFGHCAGTGAADCCLERSLRGHPRQWAGGCGVPDFVLFRSGHLFTDGQPWPFISGLWLGRGLRTLFRRERAPGERERGQRGVLGEGLRGVDGRWGGDLLG